MAVSGKPSHVLKEAQCFHGCVFPETADGQVNGWLPFPVCLQVEVFPVVLHADGCVKISRILKGFSTASLLLGMV